MASKNLLTAVSLTALLAGTSLAFAADVTFERLRNPEPQNWLMNHHDYGSQRYSPLDIINKSNVKNLKLAFAVPLGGTSGNEYVEATPLVDDGAMYITNVWGVVYKIDVRSGSIGRVAVEDGSRPAEARPQPRRRTVGQPGDFRRRLRRPRHRDRPGNRQGGVGQEARRPARSRAHGGPARAQATASSSAPRAATTACAAGSPASIRRPANCNGRPSLSPRPASPAARPGRTRPMPGRPAAARSM